MSPSKMATSKKETMRELRAAVGKKLTAWIKSDDTREIDMEIKLGFRDTPGPCGTVCREGNGTETITIWRNGGAIDQVLP